MSTESIVYQKNAMAISFYRPDQLVTYYDWTHGRDGNRNPVLHARFRNIESQFDGFAKPFNPTSAHDVTAILNEVTGWLLANACGLPCSQRAFFTALPASNLPNYNGHNPLPSPDSHGMLICFVTQAISNTAVRGVFETESLIREQSEWQHCDHAIAFDEGIANSDRHIYNLIRCGERDFALIDHGYLLRDAEPYPLHWNEGVIESHENTSFNNLLHHHTYNFLNRNSIAAGNAGLSKGMEFREQLEDAIRRSAFEISYWCSQLIPGASARWLSFLLGRTQQVRMGDLLAKRYGVLSLQ